MKGTVVSATAKQIAVDNVNNGGDITAIAKQLKVTPNTVRKWCVGKDIGKRKLKGANGGQHEAIALLRQARESINGGLRDGRIKKLGREHLLTLLALETLGGS